MHPALSAPHITSILLETILENSGGRRSISRLARTCRGLSEPALNLLWRELDSLLPLLSLFPGKLFKRPRRPGLGFLASPEAEDWKRFLSYGELVKKITYNEAAGNVHPSIFSVLEEQKTREFLLPNLESLVWKVETPEGLERSLLFLTPCLQNLTIVIGNGIPQDELLQFLKEVAEQTRLKSLSITSATRIPQSLPDLLQEHKTLESVGLVAPGGLTGTIGRWLSTLPMLKSLQIGVGDKSDGHIASFFSTSPTSGMSSPDSILTPDSRGMSGDEFSGAESMVFVNLPSMGSGFRALRHLALSGEVTSASNFLKRIPALLSSIDLNLDEPDDMNEWNVLWACVCSHFKNSLSSIVVNGSGSASSKFNDLVRNTARGSNSSHRLPLQGLDNLPLLTRLELDMPESRVFFNSDLERLAITCPNLETVKLCPLSRWPLHQGAPKATLAGLAPLTARCKRLHSLSLPVNAVGSTDESLFTFETSSRSLTRLHVGHAWVEDPFSVSILLSHLAPYLDSLKWFHEKNRPGYVEAHDIGWQRVSEILPQLQRLRLRERANAFAPSAGAYSAQDFVAVEPVKPTPEPVRPPPVVELPKIVYESRGVQVRCSTADSGVQAKPAVRHKNVSTKPYQRSTEVDATPMTVEQEVDATPPVTEEPVPASPTFSSKAVEAMEISVPPSQPPSYTSDSDEFNEKEMNHGDIGYLGQTTSYIGHIIRAISPPILLRIFDLWSMFTESSTSSPSKEHSSDVFSRPLIFSEKISPACP